MNRPSGRSVENNPVGEAPGKRGPDPFWRKTVESLELWINCQANSSQKINFEGMAVFNSTAKLFLTAMLGLWWYGGELPKRLAVRRSGRLCCRRQA